MVNRMIPDSTAVYCEPFLGSGGIYRNLKKDSIKRLLISDIDSRIVRVWESLFAIEKYSDLMNVVKKVFSDFGDISSDKASYYAFRKWFNETHLLSGSFESGLYMYILFSSCMNDIIRFGKSGFTGTFGKGMTVMTELQFLRMKELQSRTELRCEDYKESLERVGDDGFVFLDPPYFSRPIAYSKGFSAKEYSEFLIAIKKLKCRVIYTDVLDEFNSKEMDGWNMRVIRKDMKSIAPSKHSESSGYSEVMFFNFEYREKHDFTKFLRR